MIGTEDFWALVEASATATGDPDERLAWLTDRLAERSADDAVDFALRLDEARARADTWVLWGAASLVCAGLCSDDGFHYFQAWLVGLGRSTFERVVDDPDALADVPQVRRLARRSVDAWDDDEWPDWEALDYVADRAYERITGAADALDAAVEARGRELRASPDPADEEWDLDDPAELRRRYPRLAAMFRLPAEESEPGVGVWETASP
ncbi:DUF4240 domain-containing protein [Micromonospora endolithica]|uniref:DUF4240 domain-containing protein n=1 Tax=Micromonospora endolithica TaxID=230091 RepID=UPI0011AD549E|nr:DUF4240 domain-containing protein [Micromonospora endolithica]TWJ20027.1 uncharacterized protein DUF4240 [Micromonospora endolithica]